MMTFLRGSLAGLVLLALTADAASSEEQFLCRWQVKTRKHPRSQDGCKQVLVPYELPYEVGQLQCDICREEGREITHKCETNGHATCKSCFDYARIHDWKEGKTRVEVCVLKRNGKWHEKKRNNEIVWYLATFWDRSPGNTFEGELDGIIGVKYDLHDSRVINVPIEYVRVDMAEKNRQQAEKKLRQKAEKKRQKAEEEDARIADWIPQQTRVEIKYRNRAYPGTFWGPDHKRYIRVKYDHIYGCCMKPEGPNTEGYCTNREFCKGLKKFYEGSPLSGKIERIKIKYVRVDMAEKNRQQAEKKLTKKRRKGIQRQERQERREAEQRQSDSLWNKTKNFITTRLGLQED